MYYRTHTCGELRPEHVKDERGMEPKDKRDFILSGWVHKRRDLGGLIFVDLRDRYGITQIIFHPDRVKDFSIAESLKYEYVIKVKGKVYERDANKVNKEMETGGIEVVAYELEILSTAKPMPFEIFDSGKGEEDEDLRLKYRFLELRREKLRDNILFRAKMVAHIRKYMEDRGFVDIATPILTVSSPEGARDFLVPSRLHPGKFYALPQAPQQYKQLLMVAGFDRYYQIAPCMRDEDPRADRSPGEFYQLDTETSFLHPDEFFELMEPLFIELTKFAGKKVKQYPFPRIPFRTVMETYGSDRPDLRYDLPITNVTDWAHGTGFKVFQEAKFVRALVVPGGAAFTRKEIDEEFTDKAKRMGAKGLAWMKLTAGNFDGGVTKFFTSEQLQELTKLLTSRHPEPVATGEDLALSESRMGSPVVGTARTGGSSVARLPQNDVFNNSIIFFVADNWDVSCKALGAVRAFAGEKQKLADPDEIAWAWVVDFPMYEYSELEKKVDFGHNPFSMPQGGMEALTTKDPLDILAYQYDIIANGLELSSGAMRNKDPEIMYKAFEIAGYTKDDVNKKFGHMIKAFEFGAPPHCGFAPGIERLVMLLRGEPNIRAVVPFPKNQKAEEPMVGSPSEVEEKQLKELGIEIRDEIKTEK